MPVDPHPRAAFRLLAVPVPVPVAVAVGLALWGAACSPSASDALAEDLAPEAPGAAPAGGTGGSIQKAEPPGDRWVVWASDRLDGRHEIYLRKLVDGEDGPTADVASERLTRQGGSYPSWSPDGAWIAYQHGADSSTHLVRPDGSEDQQVCAGQPMFWMHDGSGVVCRAYDNFFVVDPATRAQQLLFNKKDFKHMNNGHYFFPGGISADGRWLVGHVFDTYSGGFAGDNGTFKASPSSIILDLTHRERIYFLGPGCFTTTAPTGDWVYHVSSHVAATRPDIYAMRLRDLQTRASYRVEVGRSDADWGHEYMPRISNDNGWLIYGASTGCQSHYDCDYEVFVHRLGVADDRARVTFNKANDNYPDLFVGRPGATGATP